MCAGTVEVDSISGSAKGAKGWFTLSQAQVVYDHPFHAQLEEALIMDFVDPARGPGARVSVEISADSARSLMEMIGAALRTGEHRHDVEAGSGRG